MKKEIESVGVGTSIDGLVNPIQSKKPKKITFLKRDGNLHIFKVRGSSDGVRLRVNFFHDDFEEIMHFDPISKDKYASEEFLKTSLTGPPTYLYYFDDGSRAGFILLSAPLNFDVSIVKR